MSTARREPPVELVKDLPPPRVEEAQVELPLAEVLDTLLVGRWVILAVLVATVGAGVLYALLAPRVYRADALIVVEDAKSKKGLLGDLSTLLADSSPADAEIEIFRSRSVVGEAVRELHLDVVARPRRFPLVGRTFARKYEGTEVAPARLGLARYGWGGERIRVERLDVPADLLSEELTLAVADGGRFVLRGPGGDALLEGEVGRPAEKGGIALLVAELRARPGLEFELVRHRHDDAVTAVQERLSVRERGKKTGVLEVLYEGESPERVAAVLRTLAEAYVRKNVEHRSAEAAKSLAFLEEQLPALRAELERAEKAFERHRVHSGAVDMSLETQAAIARVVEVEKAASMARVEAAALRRRFTPDHPALAEVTLRLEGLEREREALDGRMRRLPATELDAARRMRDVKVANELYLSLLNNAQTLKVAKEGTIGSVRILDAPVVPNRPVAPRSKVVLLLAAFAGLVLGVGAAFVRRILDEGIEDPEELERALGIGVHACVPFSEIHDEHERRALRENVPPPVLAADQPKDLAVEALRSLRTSVQFALVEARNNVIALSGPSPGVGKSFVSVNLAHLLGESGKRVLLVDADMRRGTLHRFYGGERTGGLSDVIAGQVPVEQATRTTTSPNVSFIPSGSIPPNPAELLGSERLRLLLEDLSRRYDLVIVDTPPILAVTDAALVGRHAGVSLLVVRAGAHRASELAAALRAFERVGVRIQGLVMNAVRLDRSRLRRYAYHYQYHYN